MKEFDGKLWHAACTGDLNLAHYALEHGADVNVTANAGTPLHKAVDLGHLEMCKLLVAAGADVSAHSSVKKGRWPLHCTFVGGLKVRLDIMRYLLELGASPNCRRGSDGGTPLHLAAQFRGPDDEAKEAIRLLLEYGADVHAVNENKLTPLHQTAGDSLWCVRNARYLVEAGADPSFVAPDAKPERKTPFQTAVTYGRRKLIEFYIDECGQSLEQKTRDGRSLSQLVAGNPQAAAVFHSILTVHSINAVMKVPQEGGNAMPTRQTRSLSPL